MSNGLPDLYEQGRQAGIREALVACGKSQMAFYHGDSGEDCFWSALQDMNGEGVDSAVEYLGLGDSQ